MTLPVPFEDFATYLEHNCGQNQSAFLEAVVQRVS